MSKTIYFKQCCLSKPTEKGHAQKVVWIPEEFAVVGRALKTKDHGTDDWENGWTVESASSNRLEESMLPDSHKGIKAHRDHTGDSTPKVKQQVL